MDFWLIVYWKYDRISFAMGACDTLNGLTMFY